MPALRKDNQNLAMKHDPRTHRLQHQEACVLLSAFEAYGQQSFTRNDLCAAADLPINVISRCAFTLLERGAFEECGRRGRSELLRIVIKNGNRRRNAG